MMDEWAESSIVADSQTRLRDFFCPTCATHGEIFPTRGIIEHKNRIGLRWRDAMQCDKGINLRHGRASRRDGGRGGGRNLVQLGRHE